MEFVFENNLDQEMDKKLDAIWVNMSYRSGGVSQITTEAINKENLPPRGESKIISFSDINSDDQSLEIFATTIFVQYYDGSSYCRIRKKVKLQVRKNFPYYNEKYSYKLSAFPLIKEQCR